MSDLDLGKEFDERLLGKGAEQTAERSAYPLARKLAEKSAPAGGATFPVAAAFDEERRAGYERGPVAVDATSLRQQATSPFYEDSLSERARKYQHSKSPRERRQLLAELGLLRAFHANELDTSVVRGVLEFKDGRFFDGGNEIPGIGFQFDKSMYEVQESEKGAEPGNV